MCIPETVKPEAARSSPGQRRGDLPGLYADLGGRFAHVGEDGPVSRVLHGGSWPGGVCVRLESSWTISSPSSYLLTACGPARC